MRRNFQRSLILLAFCGPAMFESLAAHGCPFCSAPLMTLSEQFSTADVVAVATWEAGRRGDEEDAGSTTFEISHLIKGEMNLRVKQRITLDRYREEKVGTVFFVTGSVDQTLEWHEPIRVSPASLKYILESPDPQKPPHQRLPYFVKFLEHSDSLVSNDAYGELANARYEDIAALAPQLPHAKLRQWLASTETPSTRIGLYGMLLGLCGDQGDATFLAKQIEHKAHDDTFRLGVDGLIGGYLLLTGADGLALIEETKLRNQEIPFSETFAAIQAIRFMWTYSPGKIPKQRLRESLRIMLERAEFADLIIADLARWQDWEIQDRLMGLYGKGEHSAISVRRAIIRFLLAAIDSVPEGTSKPRPRYVLNAEQNLSRLKARDPKLVADVFRFTLRTEPSAVTGTTPKVEDVERATKSFTGKVE